MATLACHEHPLLSRFGGPCSLPSGCGRGPPISALAGLGADGCEGARWVRVCAPGWELKGICCDFGIAQNTVGKNATRPCGRAVPRQEVVRGGVQATPKSKGVPAGGPVRWIASGDLFVTSFNSRSGTGLCTLLDRRPFSSFQFWFG